MTALCWVLLAPSLWVGVGPSDPHGVADEPLEAPQHPLQPSSTLSSHRYFGAWKNGPVSSTSPLLANDNTLVLPGVEQFRTANRPKPNQGTVSLNVEKCSTGGHGFSSKEVVVYDVERVSRSRKRRNVDKLKSKWHTDLTDNLVLLLKSLMLVTLAGRHVLLYHDSQPTTQAIVNELLAYHLRMPLLVLNITEHTLVSEEWFGDYNDGLYIHILLFEKRELAEEFASNLPPRVWAPQYLLLVSADSRTSASPLLSQPGLNRSPFLSLLQPVHRPETPTTTTYHILTYESFKETGKVRTEGFYTLDDVPNISQVFPDRYTHFHGHHFHLATWIDDFPYLKATPGAGDTHGFCLSMLEEISKKLNFTYQVYDFPADKKWGDFFNGSWRGLIGEVYREEKDFGINQMAILRDRNEAIDYSITYWLETYAFLLPIPEPPPRWWSISFPFRWSTWVAVVLTLFLVTLAHLLFIKVKELPAGGVSKTLLEVVRTILRLDAADLSPEDSVRMLQGVWRVVAMIVSISYTGNLVAYITAPPRPVYLRTLQHLASSSLRPMMADYGSYVPAMMRSSLDPAVRQLGHTMEIIPYDYNLALNKVLNDGYALLEVGSYLQYVVILKGAANTYMLKEKLRPSHTAWYFPKNTPWKHKFNHYILWFVELGLCQHWWKEEEMNFRRKMKFRQVTPLSSESIIRPLSLVDCQGAFIVCGTCMGIALVVSLLEIICFATGE